MDIVIRNGKIIDGTGNPWFKADLAIEDGHIIKIGHNLKYFEIINEIEASSLIVCPGFIDPHSHSDYSLPFDNRLESSVRQGITTQVVGNCGESMAPVNPDKIKEFNKFIESIRPPGIDFKLTWHSFKEYLSEMEKLGCAINLAFLVGFGTVRVAGGPGYEDRSPTDQEMERMNQYVDEAMKAGAFGLSTGLIYSPQVFSKTEEIIELAKVVANYNGLYFSHIRGEGDTVLEAIKEVIEIVEKSGAIGGQIAHHKIASKEMWGASKETLRIMEEANARGINITCDQYPYNRGMTSLITVLPPWSHVGGILKRLKNPEDRERIKHDIKEGIEGWENMIKDAGFDKIFISLIKAEEWKDVLGKNISEITKIKCKDDDFETLFDIILDDYGKTMITIELMDDKDISQIMTGRYTMIGTDGWGVSPTGVLGYGIPHPRFYGTYPRVLGRYVRGKKLLTIEEAIRKMTSFPAQKIGFRDRGILKEGNWADIVIFNPNTIIDKASYERPHQFPEGIKLVMINGVIVVENEKQYDVLPGKVLRRQT